jgi:hypothetical protein
MFLEGCATLPVKDAWKRVNPKEVDMQILFEPVHAAVPRSHGSPAPDSYDSGEEFSLYHWIKVRSLVDEKPTVSEVEPSTTNQNFSGNVV